MNPSTKRIDTGPSDRGAPYLDGWTMPGQNGQRVPLRRFFDPLGRWGYLIDNCRIDNSGIHVLYNFVLFPDAFSGKDTGGAGFSDMTNLMERNHEDNLKWVRDAGHDGYPCWSKLWGKYEGETLVIASCGPSLTESLPTLYRRRSEYRLMCLNRSMRAFQHPDVKPDFYYFVERRALPDWMHEMDGGQPVRRFDLDGVTMIGTPQCDHRAVRCFDPANAYFGYTELGALGHINDISRLAKYDIKAATTIGNAPFIAWKLGFKRIIHVGCDFSLDCHLEVDDTTDKKTTPTVIPTRMYFDKPWNQTHYANNQNWIKSAMPAIGIGNRCVEIDPILTGHRSYYEGVLDILHFDGGVECINASARGMLFFNHMDLDDALDRAKEES